MGINITGIDKAEILAALYNQSKPQGLGFIQFTPEDMEKEEAEELLLSFTNFDYLKGRVMKIDLSSDDLDPWLYDRDNGQGAAERAVKHLLQ